MLELLNKLFYSCPFLRRVIGKPQWKKYINLDELMLLVAAPQMLSFAIRIPTLYKQIPFSSDE